MAWRWETIRDEWLAGRRVATPPDEIVATFEIAGRLLGREWVESQRENAGASVKGSHPVAAVIAMGKRLRAVRNAAGLDDLLRRLRAGDGSAHAELTGAYLCTPILTPITLEFGAVANVANRQRVPDFRLRRDRDDPWLYVEVTAPDVSDVQRRAHALLEQLFEVLADIPMGSMAEVMVRRDPSDSDVAEILGALRTQVREGGQSHRDLPGLALILVGHGEPGEVVVDDHGEPNVPRIGVAKAERQGEACRHLAIRYAFSDQRAEAFLTSESRQLPRDGPSVVLADVSRASGALQSWGPLLQRRLQPRQHTRVGCVGLFASGMWVLPAGEAWMPWTVLIENPHASNPVPVWLLERLRSWTPPAASKVGGSA